MDENPSYVFFRELPGDGPLGSEGVVLTARAQPCGRWQLHPAGRAGLSRD